MAKYGRGFRMMGQKKPISGGDSPGITPLYNQQPYTHAYSLQLLNEDNYTDAVVRIRRSSDSAELSFLIDPTVNRLSMDSMDDTLSTTLGTWIGTDDGHVARLYDQLAAGAVDIAQANSVRQPQIISGGNFIILNGHPAMLFDGSRSMPMVSAVSLSDGEYLSVAICNATSTSPAGCLWGQDYGNPLRVAHFIRMSATYLAQSISFGAGGSGAATTDDSAEGTALAPVIAAGQLENLELDATLNGSSNGTTAVASSASGISAVAGNLGSRNGLATFYTGNFQELVHYSTGGNSLAVVVANMDARNSIL